MAVKRKGSRVSALHGGSRGTTLSPGISLGTAPTGDGGRELQILIEDGEGGFTVLSYSATNRDGYVTAASVETAQDCERRGVWARLEAEAARRAHLAAQTARLARKDPRQ